MGLVRRVGSGLCAIYLLALLIPQAQPGFAATWPENPTPPQPQVWWPRAAASNAPAVNPRVRIVDFGSDYLRDGDGRPTHQFGVHRYKVEKSATTGLYSPTNDMTRYTNLDLNADGTNDVIGCRPFSLTSPFSPVGAWYDSLAGTPRWYGGTAIFQLNRNTTGFSEDGVNHEHDGPVYCPRDNWALFHESFELFSPYRLSAVWLWKKEDFLNGGAANRVSFDSTSEVALYLQRYWMGVEGVRFVIQDGTQFYVSEQVFKSAGQTPGSGNGKQHVLCPANSRWAPYNPQGPYDIIFDAATATFANHDFQDVQAVGFYVFKDTMISSYFGYKWYSFEADAVVHRQSRPSESIDMVKISAGGTNDFYISTTEVPYELWKNLFRLARSNTFVRDPRGFIFNKDGDMGSMNYPYTNGLLTTHSPQEPVTGFTLLDAIAWCNALSQQEGRTPCYYTDETFSNVYHYVLQSPMYIQPPGPPTLYVKWDADGYRLPTPGEWQATAGNLFAATNGWIGSNSTGQTHAVGTTITNNAGVYDLLGNVWEPVWTFGNSLDWSNATQWTVVGGDFRWPASPTNAAASRYGDLPFDGSYNVGLRLVRREAGLAMPPTGAVSNNVPQWTLVKGQITTPSNWPVTPPTALPEMVTLPSTNFSVAKNETTFAEWKYVRDWAVTNGYTFSNDGDMGSMDYWGYPGWGEAHPHAPDEPVTDITYYDAMVWCNALSEMQGQTPVYYQDAAMTIVYRHAFMFRSQMLLWFEAKPAYDAGLIYSSSYASSYAWQDVYAKASANGYRLPTPGEFDYARTGGTGSRYGWGNDSTNVFGRAWLFDTSTGTTHQVRQVPANAFGLYDMDGNVSEMGGTPNASSILGGSANPGNAVLPRLGGSFIDLTLGITQGATPPNSPEGWGYADTGFRVFRGATQKSANVETASAPRPVEAKASPLSYDPLRGQVYRGSLLRDGVFEVPGITNSVALLWRFQTGGPVRSSPVVVNGIAYFGSYDTNFYAVNVTNGQQVWKYKTGNQVSGSAAVVNGVAYFCGEDGYVYALNATTGALVWKTYAGNNYRLASSPAVANGIVFASIGNGGGSERVDMSNGGIIGLDINTGAKIWTSSHGSQGYGSPAIWNDTLFTHHQNSLYALDLISATSKWSVTFMGQSRDFVTPAVTTNEMVYGIGSICGDVIGCSITNTNHKRWLSTTVTNQLPVTNDGLCGYEIFGSPAVANGMVYVGCNDWKLHTFNAQTGARGWEFTAGGEIQSAPAVAGNVVYFGSHDGYLYAIHATTGAQLWRYSVGQRIVSSPWPTADTVYVGCDDGYLYALRANTNSAPVITTASVQPLSPITTDNLLGVVTAASDPEGDPVSFAYQWQQSTNNTAFTNISYTTSNLPSAATIAGNYYRVLITPSDGKTNGAFFTTGSVLVVLDSDGDTLNDDWEISYFGSLAAQTGNGDPDGDGFSNAQEQVAGTNPTNGASALRITAIEPVGANLRITFASVAGKNYQVEWSSNPDLSAPTVVTNIGAVGTSSQATDPGAVGQSLRFYRVKLLP